MSARALVAGAAGFIGSHLVDRLLSLGYEVVGLDNLLTGRKQNLAHLSTNSRFGFIEADVAELPPFEGERFDWVFHLASPASPPRYLAHPIETLRANADGTRLLLELAERSGASFFLASTSEVYGDPEQHPQSETYWGNVNPIGPRSVYDEGKRYAEAFATTYHQSRGVPLRIVRIFNTYGPRMDPADGRVVTNFIGQALRGEPLTIYGDGSQTRSFQYIDDLIDGFIALMGVEHSEPVNLGNPGEFTMIELANLVREIVGSRSEIVHRPLPKDDPRRRRPDIGKAKMLLGWEPRIPLREGLRRTIEAFERD